MPNNPRSKSKIFIRAAFSWLRQTFCDGDENCSNANKSEKHVDNLKEVHIIIYS
jgi:hypothetical protein